MRTVMKAALLIPAVVLTAFLSLTEATCDFEDIRLYDNGEESQNQGMLQICDGSEWTAVCDYQWRQVYTVALCQDLGHTNSTPLTVSNNGSWPSISYVNEYTSQYSTSCYDDSIAACLTNSSYYVTSSYARFLYCNTARDTLFIQCDVDMDTCTRGSIRLYNNGTTTDTLSGMLQMCDYNRRWTAVCGYSWGCEESRVACRQLGYTASNARSRINAGPWPIFGFGPYSCSRSDSINSLSLCSSYSSHYRQTKSYCDPLFTTVHLICETRSQNESCSENYKIRIVNKTETETSIKGRVEVCYQNTWTPFCRNLYSPSFFEFYDNPYYISSGEIRAIMCNNLGDFRVAKNLSVLYRDGQFGVSTTGIASITTISCRESITSSLKYCYFTQEGRSDFPDDCSYCPGSLGLKCYYRTDCNEEDVRLVNGTIDREGRLEICTNGVWSGVCASSFRKSAAHVACKQAGYGDVMGAIVYTNGEFGIGDGPVFYRSVECFGNESYIADCKSVPLAPNYNLYPRAAVGLLCRDNCSEGSVRLTGGKHVYEGYVEVCVDGIWSHISDDGWDDIDARVVCKQLNAYGTSAGEIVDNPPYTRSNKATRFSNVSCNGDEDSIEDCRHHTIELDEGKTFDEPVAAVDCKVSVLITVPSPSQTSQTSDTGRSLKREDTILGIGVGLLILAISILVIGITIMACIIMRKLSIAKGGRNTDREQNTMQHSRLQKEDAYDAITDPNPVSVTTKPHYNDEEMLN